MKILLQKPIKYIISKAKKTLGKSTLKDPEKVKEIVKKVIRSEEFQNSKVILEYGATVGGIVMTFIQFYDPLATVEQMKALENKLDRLSEQITRQCEQVGLTPQQTAEGALNSEIIEQSTSNNAALEITSSKSEDDTARSIEAVEKENEQLRKKIKELEKKPQQVNPVSLIIFAAFAALIVIGSKPTQAFTLIEEFMENQK